MTVRWRKEMAKRDREYENRMAGYIAAYNMVKKEGIEALEKDLKIALANSKNAVIVYS